MKDQKISPLIIGYFEKISLVRMISKDFRLSGRINTENMTMMHCYLDYKSNFEIIV